MNVLIVGDVHWSEYSSIVRTNGEQFSHRLENLISSVNWAEEYSKSVKCEYVIYLGDFFDKSEINSEEISALNEIKWDSCAKHIFLCGNHEMGDKFHHSSSLKLFSLVPNCRVIDKPTYFINKGENTGFVFLPYMLEENRISIDDFLIGVDTTRKIYIFSHNDLQIQYGQYKSVNGYTIEEIERNCKYCFNGHLHNRSHVSWKVENVGNLTGQNFSEDALIYKHGVVLYDTINDTEKFIENPYAFNFYKLSEDHVLGDICLSSIGSNAIVSMTCKEENYDRIKDWLNKNAMLYRIQVTRDTSSVKNHDSEKIINVDHIAKFNDYVLNDIGNDELTRSELEKISWI